MLGRVAALLALVVSLASCKNGLTSEFETTDVIYDVSVSATEHGTITAIPDRAFAGAEIKFIVNPQTGYKLNSLKLHQGGVSNLDGSNQTDINQNSQYVYRADMPAGGVWITADFSPLATSEQSVSLVTGEHGQVLATPTYGKAGTTVRLFSFLDAGYAMKSGYPLLTGATWVSGKEGYEFVIDGGENVTVSSEFEKPTTADGLIEIAQKAMDAEEYDAAFGFYEAAYQVDKTNNEAIFYSTIGKLLSIGTDPRVRVLLRKPGMVSTSTPGTINDWLDFGTSKSTNWLTTYTDDSGVVYKLPRLGAPAGNLFPGSFLNYDVYQKNTGKRKLFDILLFWDMIGNNPNGFNSFIDDSLEYVFGDEFEEASARAATLPSDAVVSLNEKFKENLDLSSIYGTDSTTVGRAELDVLFSFLRSMKAALEWGASYDWEMNLKIFLYEVGISDTVNDSLYKMSVKTIEPLIKDDESNISLARILPLRSQFMKCRDSGMMSKAMLDLQTAADSLDGSFSTVYGRFSESAKAKCGWMLGDSGFIKEFKSALASGSDFYFPTIPQYKTLFDAMEGQSSWVTADNARTGVNLRKLFTYGYLSVDRLIATESSGKAPLFFGFSGGEGNVVASESDIEQFDTFSMKFGQSFKDVFIKIKGIDASDYQWVSDVFPDIFPQSGDELDKAKTNVNILYDYYQRR